jgi:hypothetical protein
MVAEIDLATKDPNSLHSVLANGKRCVGSLYDTDNGWNGEMKIFFQIGTKRRKSSQDTQLRCRPSIARVAFENLKHEGKKARQVHLEFPFESESDGFDQVNYDDL